MVQYSIILGRILVESCQDPAMDFGKIKTCQDLDKTIKDLSWSYKILTGFSTWDSSISFKQPSLGFGAPASGLLMEVGPSI